MKNKLIVIEGTDASGKNTQSQMLKTKLNQSGYTVEQASFPMYDTPTGKIIAGAYLGKENYGESYFKEGAVNVDPKVAGLYFAADRYYNKARLEELLSKSHVVLDRYVESNMAHQAGKHLDPAKRHEVYKWFEKLEYNLLELPKPDIRVLLYMPRKFAKILKANRPGGIDEHEKDENYLMASEQAYLEIAKLMNYHIITCVKDDALRSIEEINDELVEYIKGQI